MTSYRASLGIDQARSLGKMKAQLASQGGANGTALTYASMMLEDSTNKNVAQYEAQLRSTMLQMNVSFLTNLVSVFVSYKSSVNSAVVAPIIGYFNQKLTTYVQAIVSVIGQMVQSGSSAFTTEIQYSDALTRSLINLYGSVEAVKMDKQMSWGIQYASQLLSMIESKASFDLQKEQILTDISNMQANAYGQFLSTKTDWEVRKLTWPIELMQREANILAAPAGAVVNAQNPPGWGEIAMKGLGSIVGGALVAKKLL
jgi:hypothetical protein